MSISTGSATATVDVPYAEESSGVPKANIDSRGAYIASVPNVLGSDALAREVYCILGVPIDVVSMADILRAIDSAALSATPYLISTPNLNFLISSRSNVEFRESLLASNLCPADGMPIVWVARLLRLPIRQRIAGSDIFQALKTRQQAEKPVTVFFFGGAEGVASAAANVLNEKGSNLICVGYLNPGFGSVETLSGAQYIHAINNSNADFLVVALGAVNGQAWLTRNHDRIQIPIRSHLGATINFVAGAVKRAPAIMRMLGFEWLWRIKEEPHLWRRYWNDGRTFLSLLFTRVLPLMLIDRAARARADRANALAVTTDKREEAIHVRLSGYATADFVSLAMSHFRNVLAEEPTVVALDLSETEYIDARFLGLLMMLRQQLMRSGARLRVTKVSKAVNRQIHLHEANFMLEG